MADEGFARFTQENFDAEVLQRTGLTLVDFWAEWCLPCRQMSKVLGQLAPELPEGVRVGKVNADENPALLERFGVKGIPTLLFFKDGQLLEAKTGVDRKQVLKKAIERYA